MPLPRFQNLDEPRRRAILTAAAEEFAEHGFAAASYNRIIERAGISKGAMYYYFADKEDLFATVLDTALAQWFEHVGMPEPARDAASFWAACNETYARSVRFMLADRCNASLCLAITRAREQSDGQAALAALNEKMHAFASELVRHGRAVGAVRTDIPEELMVQVALSLVDAGDRWLARHWTEMTPAAADATAATMVDLLRRVASTEKS
ncbi:MAG: helix-turn-helix domain-containing protein [Polyangiaceae bacterium]